MHPTIQKFLDRMADNPRNITVIEVAEVLACFIEHTAPYEADLDNGSVEGNEAEPEKRKPGRPKLSVKTDAE